ncbi:enhanced serine sensitivity protein SseB C-terminal domain-containing protein [Hymenobacter jejuensis]|uniref:Enhanced serine sensitivity protein SseB n=1 Tax=Hymenobacter jejuensis TaxID=2502781 RepID=A0A5B8A536_9BACT|nr:enhanced serine sensitivity protein SseB C-terminal domain-containing protein [Hymenobacter jejuensis]QDA61695.1 hypothetical protein FHG12_17035 [Hymenobacter jejuensis]
MGLFDFLKSKKQPTEAPATPAPSSTPTPSAPASGPRYKGANYTMPTPAASPSLPPPPPMPAPPPPFQPTNRLEEVLLQAAATNDAASRLAFYHALLEEDLLVLTIPKEGFDAGEQQIEAGTEIQLQVLNDGKLPVFTSQDRIFDAEVVKEQVPFLRLRGHDLFSMAQGAEFALNPFSTVGKLLQADEIADMLSGRIFQGPDGQPAEPQGMQVILGPPTEDLSELIKGLSEFCAAHPPLQAAYLTQMIVQNAPEAPRLLLAFRSDNSDPAFLEELGPVIQAGLQQKEMAVDMMLLDPASQEPIVQYFTQIEPFYQRTEA